MSRDAERRRHAPAAEARHRHKRVGTSESGEALPRSVRASLDKAYLISCLHDESRLHIPFTASAAVESVMPITLVYLFIAFIPFCLDAFFFPDTAPAWELLALFSYTAGGVGVTSSYILRRFQPLHYPMWCTAAYYGTVNRMGPGGETASRRMNVPEPAKSGQARLRSARRWARVLTAAGLAQLTVTAISFWVGVLWFSWMFHLVHSAHPVSRLQALTGAFNDVGWHLAAAIPALDIPGTAQWAEPRLFAGDRVAAIELLAVKLTVFAPLLAAVVTLVRGSRLDPRDHPAADPIARTVIDGKRRYPSRPSWEQVIERLSEGAGPLSAQLRDQVNELAARRGPDTPSRDVVIAASTGEDEVTRLLEERIASLAAHQNTGTLSGLSDGSAAALSPAEFIEQIHAHLNALPVKDICRY